MEIHNNDAVGKFGMVSTPSPLATLAAVEILESGGSAADAAIAANAVLSVVLPDQCGLGGDLFALLYDPSAPEEKVVCLNGSGCAPKSASVESYRSKGFDSMPQDGPFSVTVPGAVRSWGELHGRYGKLPWNSLFTSAIRLAKDGFPVTKQLSNNIQSAKTKIVASHSAQQLFFPGQTPLKPGDLLIQPTLAETFSRIMDEGCDTYYQGGLSNLFIESFQKHDGLFVQQDLSSFYPEWITPDHADYQKYRIYTSPSPSRGPILIEMLRRLNDQDPSREATASTNAIYSLVQAYIESVEKCESCLGDPRFSKSEVINETASSPSQNTTVPLKGDTIAICVVDANMLGISLIQSIYHDFGSGVYLDDMGFFLQNRGASFNFAPESPNCLQPGKRPVHTLIPCMVTRDNKLVYVVGTRGGAGQPQTLIQLLTSVIDHQYSVQDSLDNPRWIYGSLSSAKKSSGLIAENRSSSEALGRLVAKGLTVNLTDPFSLSWMGCAQMIAITDDGTMVGGADPRGGGLAFGINKQRKLEVEK